MNLCAICHEPQADELCDECWQAALYRSALIQEQALEAGRARVREGRPVIWIHGRPYADPADAAEHEGTDQ